MPKGQKAVIWNGEQDAKLFHTILAVHKFDINYNAVAKAFGDNVPGSCIATRMGKLRKKANALGLQPLVTATQVSSTTPTNGKPISRTAVATNMTKKRKRGGMLTSDSDGDDESLISEASEEENDGKRFRTAPATPSRQMSIAGQIKPRASPRNLAKKDYKTIEDPFIGNGTHDADGNEIFEKSASESDDNASDGEYGKGEDIVKVEQEVGI